MTFTGSQSVGHGSARHRRPHADGCRICARIREAECSFGRPVPAGRLPGKMPTYQQRETVVDDAAAGRHTRRNLAEVPGVDAGRDRHWARAGQHLSACSVELLAGSTTLTSDSLRPPGAAFRGFVTGRIVYSSSSAALLGQPLGIRLTGNARQGLGNTCRKSLLCPLQHACPVTCIFLNRKYQYHRLDKEGVVLPARECSGLGGRPIGGTRH